MDVGAGGVTGGTGVGDHVALIDRLPFGDVQGLDALDRRLLPEEYEAVVDHLLALGLEDGFVQELSSSDEKYIPSFDLTGV